MEKIKNVKLYEQVVDRVKKMILSGKYQKGDLLPSEKDLVQTMGVSRISVREALRILAEVGIIEKIKGKGSIVLLDARDLMTSDTNKNEYHEYRKKFDMALQTQLLLEPEIIRQAALLATDEDINNLEKITHLEQEEDDYKGKGLDDFHYYIVSILKNDVLTQIYEEVRSLSSDELPGGLIAPGRQEAVIETLNEQHRKIFQAIKDRNGEFAYFYAKEHILYSMNLYKEYFDRFYE